MFTLVTGAPGSGKTYYTVSRLIKAIIGTTVEVAGVAVPCKVFTNIPGLLLDHELIDAASFEKWHEWAKPGDVIVFDEVQEVWRPRAMGSKVPPAVAALETHRHMGVDIIVISQHPMLVDGNVRRLVNRHLHVRRMASGMSMIYEWDAATNPQMTRTAINSSLILLRAKEFGLYTSAQAHTKSVKRMPRVLWVGVAALVAMLVVAPLTFARISSVFDGGAVVAPGAAASSARASGLPGRGVPAAAGALAIEPVPESPVRSASGAGGASVGIGGCVSSRTACKCFDGAGALVPNVPDLCKIDDKPPANLDAIYGPGPQLRHVGAVPASAGVAGSMSDADLAMIEATRLRR